MAKVAIIGTGIAGLGAAYLLHRVHDITVYEKSGRLGGHTRTINVRYGEREIAVDTGFIVFNRPNYPHFSRMLDHLGVRVHESDMSFAATIDGGRFEWGAKNLNAVLGQRRNVFSLDFYRICRDVARFNAQAPAMVERHPGLSLGELIASLNLGEGFRDYYLLPMGGAIWSCPLKTMLDFPAASFVKFFANHGLLQFSRQPQWYTVTGGAKTYVARLTAAFADRIRAGRGAATVTRTSAGVRVTDETGQTDSFDHVVFACHGDEALGALGDPTAAERDILGAFRYQKNHAVLHKDASVMPKRRRCWASWVYRSEGEGEDAAISVSYWMNRLQGIDDSCPLFVTLNATRAIPEDHVFDRHDFMHPIFDAAAIAAQTRVQAMQGNLHTWFCGAHLRHGFHEDGLWSAVTVATRLGAPIPWVVPEAEAIRSLEPKPALTGAGLAPA
jgi:predicted NAD/FAD-binding protein